MSVKKALAVKKTQVFSNKQYSYLEDTKEPLVGNIILDNLDLELLDRPECETNFDYFQLIPYISLVDYKTGRIFIYTRGNKSNEGRLVGKCSIGIGGHIEDEGGANPANTLLNAAIREIEEEIGIDLFDDKFNYIHQYLNKRYTSPYIMTMASYIDEVSRVHLGIPTAVVVDMEAVKEHSKLEHGVITKGEWLTKTEIINQNIELEEWSKIILAYINVRNEDLPRDEHLQSEEETSTED